ncbi:hypothetical protein [Sporocytophaga myxococcoides]|uniref:hypothetical protein n=1 Tax=Sporocytophaga myxococcoides TaxID=153721 RepID=UPI00048D4A6B|nr:hypothetical protein [Sporocytophaga myxococcoides]
MRILPIATTSIMLLLSIQTFSQNNFDSYKMAEKTVQELNDRMLLTSQKKDSLILIFNKYYSDKHLNRSKDNEKFAKAIEQNRDMSVKQVLSPFSYQEYLRYLEEQKSKVKTKDRVRHGEREATDLIDF